MDPEPQVSVGDPLSPAKAGFLEMELAARGIEFRTRQCEPGESPHANRQVVEVAPADLAAALEARAAALQEGVQEAEGAPRRRSGGRRATVIAAAAVGLVAVARLGRLFHVGLRGLLGISAAVALVIALFLVPSGDAESREETRRKAKP